MLDILSHIFEIFASNLEILFSNLEILTPALWACFTAYAAWYFASAKQYAPLTHKEARILWEIHKRKTQCSSEKWHKIKRKDRVIGFKCDCGYKHIQRKPITANTSIEEEAVQQQTSVFDKLHTTCKSK
jgi:hypothetical protein